MTRSTMPLLVAILIAVPVAAGTSAQFHPGGSLERTGNFAVKGVPELHGVAWSAHPGDTPQGVRDPESPAVADGVVVTAPRTGGGPLMAFDAKTGKRLWSYGRRPNASGANLQTFSAPVIVDGVVYAGFYEGGGPDWPEGKIVAVALKTGKELWRLPSPRSEKGASLAAVGDRLYVATTAGEVHQLDRATGRSLWAFRYAKEREVLGPCGGPAGGGSGGIVSEGILYIGGKTQLHAFEANTGKEKWRFAECPKVALANGVLYGTSLQTLYAIDPATGAVRWRVQPPKSKTVAVQPLSAPVVADGVVFASVTGPTNSNVAIYGWDAASGQLVWQRVGEPCEAKIVAASGILYFTGADDATPPRAAGPGFIYAMEIKSKQILWKHEMGPPEKYSGRYWPTDFLTPAEDGLYYSQQYLVVKLQ
jgi:outer membrane protein assembly factor BamB